MSKVVIEKHISYELRDWFRDRGYRTCSITGMRGWDDMEPVDAFGVLQPRLDKKFGPFRRKQRGIFLGVLWLSNINRGARSGHWVFELFGISNEEKVWEFLEELSTTYNTYILLKLEYEAIRYEEYLGDGAFD